MMFKNVLGHAFQQTCVEHHRRIPEHFYNAESVLEQFKGRQCHMQCPKSGSNPRAGAVEAHTLQCHQPSAGTSKVLWDL